MSTLLGQMTDICVYLWEVTRNNTTQPGEPEIHLPRDVFDRLNYQLHPLLVVTTETFLPKDELRINGVIIKRKQ